MKINKTIFILLLIPLLAFTHKFYLSLTQIVYKENQQIIQIIINVFMDDIELALNKNYNIDLQLTTKNELQNNDVYFEKYLRERLKISVNNTEKKYTYIGKEYEGDLVYFYLEIENISQVNTLKIINKILTTHFPNQQNLVKCEVENTHKSLLLTRKNDNGLLKFQ